MRPSIETNKEQTRNCNFDLSIKIENFILEIIPAIRKFPKMHKFTLGQKIEQSGIELAEIIFYIQYVPASRSVKIVEANMKVQVLVLLVRLAQKLNCITLNQYERFSFELIEIGKVLSSLKQAYEKNR